MNKVEKAFEMAARIWIVAMIIIIIYTYFNQEIGIQLVILGLLYAGIHAIAYLVYRGLIKKKS